MFFGCYYTRAYTHYWQTGMFTITVMWCFSFPHRNVLCHILLQWPNHCGMGATIYEEARHLPANINFIQIIQFQSANIFIYYKLQIIFSSPNKAFFLQTKQKENQDNIVTRSGALLYQLFILLSFPILHINCNCHFLCIMNTTILYIQEITPRIFIIKMYIIIFSNLFIER